MTFESMGKCRIGSDKCVGVEESRGKNCVRVNFGSSFLWMMLGPYLVNERILNLGFSIRKFCSRLTEFLPNVPEIACQEVQLCDFLMDQVWSAF